MKRSNRLILLIGVLLAAVAFVGILVLSGGQQPGETPDAEPTKLPTVFAKTDIPLGVRMTAEMLEVRDLEITQRSATAFENTGLLIGKIARNDIKKGAQLTSDDINAGRTGLTSVSVPPGLVAIAVQVDQVSGVGTVINRGDYVDMVVGLDFSVTQIDPETGELAVVEGIDGTSVKMLLQSMLVVGTLLPPPPAQTEGAPVTDRGTVLNGQQEIVILAVTPQQAEVIKFAQIDGSITLVLRSPDDFVDENGDRVIPEDVVTTGIVLKSLIDDYGVLTPLVVEAILPSPTP